MRRPRRFDHLSQLLPYPRRLLALSALDRLVPVKVSHPARERVGLISTAQLSMTGNRSHPPGRERHRAQSFACGEHQDNEALGGVWEPSSLLVYILRR